MLSKSRRVYLSVAVLLLAAVPLIGAVEQTKKCFDAVVEDGVKVLAISNDGDFMVAGSFTDVLHFYRGGLAPTGFMKGGYDFLKCLAAHPTDNKVMAAAWGRIRIIDAESRKTTAELKTKGKAQFVAWGKEGIEIVSVDGKFTVQVWDVLAKKSVTTWSLPLDKQADIAFTDYSDNSRLLAVATRDGHIRVFEVDSGRMVGAVMTHATDEEVRITGLDFHPNGRLLATCSYGRFKIWDVSGAELKASATFGGLARGVKFFANGKKLAMADYLYQGYGFTFYDAGTGKLTAQGIVTEYDQAEQWDMALPDYEDPIIFFSTMEFDPKVYLCRYSSIIGKSRGVTVIQ